jgi:hypothetical protein
MDEKSNTKNRTENLRHGRPLVLTLLGFPNAVNTPCRAHHNSGDGERVARSLLEDVEDASIGSCGLSVLRQRAVYLWLTFSAVHVRLTLWL